MDDQNIDDQKLDVQMDNSTVDPNKKSEETMAHLEGHIQYPASKQDIVDACNNMSDVSEEDKNWVLENLPDGTYQNADEVKTALNLE